VAATALLLCSLQPFRLMRLFLAGIAVLSFYLCLTGWRATKLKTGHWPLPDRLLVWVALGCGLAMAAFGTYLMVLNGPVFLACVFLFFGLILTAFGWQDLQQIRQTTPDDAPQLHWFYQHFTRMGASYIATFTAAVVTNYPRYAPANVPEWLGTLVWVAPSLLGGALIFRTVIGYKKMGAD
jgi:hypothetical protein